MRFPLSLHLSASGDDADLMDHDGHLIAEFVDADVAKEVLDLIQRGRSVYRQTDAYGLDTCLNDMAHAPEPVDRRLAELARESDLSRHFNLPNPADAVHDSPTD